MPRYIDADELIVLGLDNPDDEHLFEFVPKEFIDNAPIADVVEVKHGKWIQHVNEPSLWSCSICETVIYSEHQEDRLKFHKWCGCCGADMRGGSNDRR